MDMDFVTWLTAEMDKRGWSNSELARQSGVAQSNISMVISQQKNAGLSFCLNVAQAFNVPPDTVLRRAGLLPKSAEGDPVYLELVEVAKSLSQEELENALEYLLWRYRQQEGGKQGEGGTHHDEEDQ